MIGSAVQKFAMALLRMSQLLHKAASHFPPEESRVRVDSKEAGFVLDFEIR